MVLENFLIDKAIVWDRVSEIIHEQPVAKPGRMLQVSVTNNGTVEDLTGCALNLAWRHTVTGIEGLEAFNVIDITKGQFIMEYTPELLSNIGNLKASLFLVDPIGNVMAESDEFTIAVGRSVIDLTAQWGVPGYSALAQILVNENDRQEFFAMLSDMLTNGELVGPQGEQGIQGEPGTPADVTKIFPSPVDMPTLTGADGYIVAYDEASNTFVLKKDEGTGGGMVLTNIDKYTILSVVNMSSTNIIVP